MDSVYLASNYKYEDAHHNITTDFLLLFTFTQTQIYKGPRVYVYLSINNCNCSMKEWDKDCSSVLLDVFLSVCTWTRPPPAAAWQTVGECSVTGRSRPFAPAPVGGSHQSWGSGTSWTSCLRTLKPQEIRLTSIWLFKSDSKRTDSWAHGAHVSNVTVPSVTFHICVIFGSAIHPRGKHISPAYWVTINTFLQHNDTIQSLIYW